MQLQFIHQVTLSKQKHESNITHPSLQLIQLQKHFILFHYELESYLQLSLQNNENKYHQKVPVWQLYLFFY